MAWITDNIPWYVYLIVLGGGGGALLALVPGALAFVVSVYAAMPVWLRYLTGAVVVAWLAHVAGKNIGRRNARAEQEALDNRARDTARDVVHENDQRTDTQIDKRLEETGGFWDDKPPRGNNRNWPRT